ncbi:MAG: hypothetical protein EOO28_00090 [Comamonadaceae bacterium]|nr:MAG: hypothetical protein EOO28_00090 [Comamonadaceae bacterium]
MPFNVTPMFPGDLYDTADRMAASAAPAWSAQKNTGGKSAQWAQILELGWQGVLVSEDNDGVGASLAEFAAIAEAAGRHALATPLIARCVVAPMLLASAGGNAAAKTALARLAAGQASVCPVLQEASGSLQAIATTGGSVRLQGMLKGADLTEPADLLVVNAVAIDGSTPVLVLLPFSGLEAKSRYFEGLDGRRTADINLDGVVVEADHVLLRGKDVAEAVDKARSTGAVMTSVQAVGAMGAMVEQTIDYLSTRSQFGVLLSTFQALRHKTVEMYVAYENARGLVKDVTEALSADPAASRRDASLTKLYLATVGRTVSETAIQLHGGMGMTVEMPAARLAMHTLMCNLQYGDRLHYLDELSSQMSADIENAALQA